MAQPKKKTSKAKSRSRHANWLRKANLQAERAMSLGRSILTERAAGFYYPRAEEDTEE
ncbi:MAG: 50S ribosomal protein L32 [Synechococcaceae cyanobacterium SM2_3_1]|nr:50S ribosomal protein L32 [Synechococcaceae cyanobacterium SM2_3_1]